MLSLALEAQRLVSIPWRGFVVFRQGEKLVAGQEIPLGFNPLAGIRCIQTWGLVLATMLALLGFQSPGGDSLYSDSGAATLWGCQLASFNPLAGIRCIQTQGFTLLCVTPNQCFNPLAGIRCIQTAVCCYE